MCTPSIVLTFYREGGWFTLNLSEGDILVNLAVMYHGFPLPIRDEMACLLLYFDMCPIPSLLVLSLLLSELCDKLLTKFAIIMLDVWQVTYFYESWLVVLKYLHELPIEVGPRRDGWERVHWTFLYPLLARWQQIVMQVHVSSYIVVFGEF